jgi:diguanylate cyclase (GGDEF)-like protein
MRPPAVCNPMRLARLARVSLAARLVGLIVFVSLLAGSLVGIAALQQTRSALRNEILQRSLAAADLAAALTTEYFAQTQADARELAGRAGVQQAVASGDFANLNAMLERWLTEHPRAATVYVTDLNGVARATGRADTNLLGVSVAADKDWLMYVYRTHSPVMGEPGLGVATGAPRVPFAVPLKDEQGNLRDVLVVSISLDALSNTLHKADLGQNAELSLVDVERNIVLAHVDRSRELQPMPRTLAVAHLLAGQRDAIEAPSSQDERALTAFEPVPGGRWGILIEQPTADAFASLQDLTRTMLELVAIAVATAVLVGLLLALHIRRPLSRLRAATNAMANGRLDMRTGIKRPDEIGQLARDFDNMASALERQQQEFRAASAALAHQANHDALTGLPNRVLFHSRLEDAIAPGKPFGLCLLDLDGFKEINDTLGHDAGDLVLWEVARRLSSEIRPGDLVARLGGDEFALLLDGVDASAASRVTEQMIAVLERGFEVAGQRLDVRASVGIAIHPSHGEDPATLLRRADMAMYEAKRSHARCMVFAPELDQDSTERLTLLSDLREAIETDQLELFYQPKQDVSSGLVTGVEALVRWQRPGKGMIGPDRFIPLAEQTGLIGPLTDWVLRAAVRQAHEWQRRYPDMRVAVNLSMRNLLDSRLAETVAGLLDEWPAQLDVEITESALMADPEHALGTLSALSELGVRIAIDDFGTGYSSLAYLKRLPVDVLKIDRSFVRDLRANSNDRIIVRSTIDLAHNLGLRVVAEGVEDAVASEMLHEFGCDEMQGYYLSRPMPAADLERWLASWSDAGEQAAA